MSQTFANRPIIKSLSFENLTFCYDSGSTIFEEVNFDFPMDNFAWIRSHHKGSGRATLLQIMAGLAPINSGKYLINEENVSEMSFEKFLPYRLSIGYSFGMGGLLHNKTLLENLTLPLLYHKLCSPEEAETRVNSYMQEMGILRYKDQRPSGVQGSVRKIACLLRPILINPQILLLDDPSLGLGQDMILKYFDLIQGLRQQGLAKHIFISTYDEKLMSLIEYREIFIDQRQLFSSDQGSEKKVVHL